MLCICSIKKGINKNTEIPNDKNIFEFIWVQISVKFVG